IRRVPASGPIAASVANNIVAESVGRVRRSVVDKPAVLSSLPVGSFPVTEGIEPDVQQQPPARPGSPRMTSEAHHHGKSDRVFRATAVHQPPALKPRVPSHR